MVVIRMQRRGTKKTPHHRIVVIQRARKQGGRVLENLGCYDPSCEPPKFSVDASRVRFWVSQGAQLSETVAQLVKRHPESQAKT